MLLAQDHSVHFFQKRRLGRRAQTHRESDRLWLHTSGHIIHHQLKSLHGLNAIDAYFLKRVIGKQLGPHKIDVVLNFCYDFYFLRDLFPNIPIIHIVNDDYISAAIRTHKRSARQLLHRSAIAADHNLVVSYLIEQQIREATDNVSLFFPWARHRYEKPTPGRSRNEVLYWGYINDRIDESIVMAIMESGIRINFIGTVTPSSMTSRILSHANAKYLEPRQLETIPHILENCSSAIIPYDIDNPYNPAVTISNRGFELLSFGLPLIFSNLPNLIRAPDNLVYRCKTHAETLSAIARAKRTFDTTQPDIEEFLEDHVVEKRYQQLSAVVASTLSTYSEKN